MAKQGANHRANIDSLKCSRHEPKYSICINIFNPVRKALPVFPFYWQEAQWDGIIYAKL